MYRIFVFGELGWIKFDCGFYDSYDVATKQKEIYEARYPQALFQIVAI